MDNNISIQLKYIHGNAILLKDCIYFEDIKKFRNEIKNENIFAGSKNLCRNPVSLSRIRDYNINHLIFTSPQIPNCDIIFT